MTIDARGLERLWALAHARPVVSAFRTAIVGVDSTEGPVLAGVDADGRRHLLVPLAARQTLRQDVDGKAVILRARTLEDEQSYRRYASLELVDERQTDLFTALCVEVADRIAAAPGRAVAALRKVLDDWRALLAGNREVLGPSALAGLFGELQLLRTIVERDPGSVDVWTGPTGSAQDFHRGLHAVEVKTTLVPEGRTVHVHGADQLDVAPPGRLLLHWMRLRSDRGRSVPELIEEIRSGTDDVASFHSLLRRVGYHDTDREIYGRQRFEVVEHRTYAIGPGFPRIVPAGLTGDAVLGGVGPIEYTVDLDAAAAEAGRTDLRPVDFLLEDE
jgi:hypothetical protein